MRLKRRSVFRLFFLLYKNNKTICQNKFKLDFPKSRCTFINNRLIFSYLLYSVQKHTQYIPYPLD